MFSNRNSFGGSAHNDLSMSNGHSFGPDGRDLNLFAWLCAANLAAAIQLEGNLP